MLVKRSDALPTKPRRKVTAKQLANLRPPWKKGEIANPRGITGPIPKGTTVIAHQLKHFMALQCPERIKKKLSLMFPNVSFNELTSGEAIWLGTIVDAQSGDPNAREFVAQRTEGKVPQTIRYEEDIEPPKYTNDELAAMADALDKVRGNPDGSNNTTKK